MKHDRSQEPKLKHRLELLELCIKTDQEQKNLIDKDFWEARSVRNEALMKLEAEHEAKRKAIKQPLELIEKAQKEMDRELFEMRSEAEEIRKKLHHIERSRKYNYLQGKRLATPIPMVAG